jgi:glyoxylase-like metal-dependent hydrolase (beta-lactamase superfamily II)
MEVAEGVHRLTQGVTNMYLVDDGGTFALVDAGTPRDWHFVVRAIAALGHRLNDVDAILLTHAHPDHTGFAERARTTAGVQVRIHRADEHAATTGEIGGRDGKITSYLFKLEMYRTVFSLLRRGATRVIPIREVSTFADGETLDVPGHPRVIHAPGHTSGSCALLLEGRGVLLAGDVLATRNPLTGRVGPQIMPGALNTDSSEALRSLRALDGVSAESILPGHGEPWRDGVAEALRLARDAGRS